MAEWADHVRSATGYPIHAVLQKGDAGVKVILEMGTVASVLSASTPAAASTYICVVGMPARDQLDLEISANNFKWWQLMHRPYT